MSDLSSELRAHGLTPTGKESPFDEDGQLWENSYELICDKTGKVIRDGDPTPKTQSVAELSDNVPRYRNSGRVILPGGHGSNYDWGYEDDTFIY